MKVTIYHNPRCSKSRATLELLRDRGLEPEIVEYLKNPPDPSTLAGLLDALRMEPRQLLRTGEPEYEQHGLSDAGLSRSALIALMVEHPRLIERPIVVADGRARIGRPPQAVLEILRED